MQSVTRSGLGCWLGGDPDGLDLGEALAAIRAHQLYLGNVTGSGPHSLYTVPTGKRAIIKHIGVQCASGAAADLEFYVPSVLDFWVFHNGGAGGLTSLSERFLWTVLNAGQELRFLGSAGKTYGVEVSGYELYV